MKSNELSLSAEDLSGLLEAVVSKRADIRLKVNGFSMYPFIKGGDVVTISPLSKVAAGIGKIVAFYRPPSKRMVIHRIVGRNRGYYLIKGDNILGSDGFVPEGNVFGTVTKIERRDNVITLGLGQERVIIAFLSKNGLLAVVFRCWRMAPSYLRNGVKAMLGCG